MNPVRKLLQMDRRLLYALIIIAAVLLSILILSIASRPQTASLPPGTELIETADQIFVTVSDDLSESERQRLQDELERLYPTRSVNIDTRFESKPEYEDFILEKSLVQQEMIEIEPEDLSNQTDGPGVYGE